MFSLIIPSLRPPPSTPEPTVRRTKAFILNSCSLKETQDYLLRDAFNEMAGCMIKLDDVASTLVEIATLPSSRTTRRLLPDNTFFMACPYFYVVHNQVTLGEIHGKGFSLFIDN